MNFFLLFYRSIMSRLSSVLIFLLSLILGLSGLFLIHSLNQGLQKTFFAQSANIDLIVGAKGGKIELLMSSLFHTGQVKEDMPYAEYESLKNSTAVKTAIPLGLGDQFQGYRVIATDQSLLTGLGLSLAQGDFLHLPFAVVLGAKVAQNLQISLGKTITLSHGIESHSIHEHDHLPFTVKGILSPSHTPWDQAVFITLKGQELLHWDHDQLEATLHEDPELSGVRPKQLSAVLIQLKSRAQILFFEYAMAQKTTSSLMAIKPVQVLTELWAVMSGVQTMFSVFAFLIVLIGLIQFSFFIIDQFQKRRPEFFLFKTIGLSPFQIFGLFCLEQVLILTLAIGLSWSCSQLALSLLGPWLENHYGLVL